MQPKQETFKRRRRRAVQPPATIDLQCLDDYEQGQLGAAIEAVQRVPFDDPSNVQSRIAGCLVVATHILAAASRYADHFNRPTRKIIAARYAVVYALSEAHAGAASPGAV